MVRIMRSDAGNPLTEKSPDRSTQKFLYIFYLVSGILILSLALQSVLEEIGLWPWEESEFLFILYLMIIFSLAFVLLRLLILFPVLLGLIIHYRRHVKLSLPLALLMLTLLLIFSSTWTSPGTYNAQTATYVENPITVILDTAGMISLLAYAIIATAMGWLGVRSLRRS